MRVLAFGDPLWGDAAHLALYHSAHGHEVRTAGPGDRSHDYIFEPHETTTEFLARISGEWAPDVLYFGFPEMYAPPLAVEDCPIPTVAAISDWNLYGPQLEYNLCRFDAVLSDQQGATSLKVHGIQPQFLFPLYSHRTHIHHRLLGERPRDIDVLFLGNLNHAIHRERGAILETVAKASEGMRVVIDAGLPPEQYALRLNEAKIALNYGVRGEMNLRCFEAPACGALLFIEDENYETFDWLEPGVHCVSYDCDNVVARIRYFLEHEEHREQIAAAGHARIQELAAEKRLDALFNWMGRVPRGQRAFHQLDARRKALADGLLYGSSMNAEQRAWARQHLLQLRALFPSDGEVLLACGCAAFDHAAFLAASPARRDERRALFRESIEAFDAAAQALPGEIVPLLNLAVLSRQAGAEVEQTYLTRALDAQHAKHGAYLLGKVNDPYYAAWRLALALGTAAPEQLHAAAHLRLAERSLGAAPAAAHTHAHEAIARMPEIGGAYTVAGRAAKSLGYLDLAAHELQQGLPRTAFDALHRQALIEVLRAQGRDDEARALLDESIRIFSVCPPFAAFVSLFESLR